jgi:hypothetical protein
LHKINLSLSINKRFLLNPPLKKGDIGGFTSGCLEKIPSHPPFAKGEKLFTDKFLTIKRHSRESGNPEEKDWIPGQARNDNPEPTHAGLER